MLLHGGELFLHKFGLMGEGGASSAGALLLAFTRRSAITFSTRPASPLTLPMAARWSMLRKWRRTKAPARPNSTTGRKSGSRRTRWSGSDYEPLRIERDGRVVPGVTVEPSPRRHPFLKVRGQTVPPFRKALAPLLEQRPQAEAFFTIRQIGGTSPARPPASSSKAGC
jgi:hypothetical protein